MQPLWADNYRSEMECV